MRRLPAGDVIVHGTVFLLGLLIWSLEFDFAQALLDRAKVPAQKAWDEARRHPWRTGLASGGGVGIVVLLIVLALRYGLVEHARGVFT